MLEILQSHGSDIISAGTSFVNLVDRQANEVTIVNETGVALDILPAGEPSTDFITISSPAGLTLPCTATPQEYSIRRNDQSPTPVTVRYFHRRWLK